MYSHCALHGAARVGTEDAGCGLGAHAQRTQAAKPRAVGNVRHAVARLVHADITVVAEYHLVAVLALRLQRSRSHKQLENDVFICC